MEPLFKFSKLSEHVRIPEVPRSGFKLQGDQKGDPGWEPGISSCPLKDGRTTMSTVEVFWLFLILWWGRKALDRVCSWVSIQPFNANSDHLNRKS